MIDFSLSLKEKLGGAQVGFNSRRLHQFQFERFQLLTGIVYKPRFDIGQFSDNSTLLQAKESAFFVLLAMSTKTIFPHVVKSRSAVVKIYISRSRQSGEHLQIRYYTRKKLTRLHRSILDEARSEARRVAEKLAARELQVLKLVGQVREEYLTARTNLQPTGISITLATKEYDSMLRMQDGASPLEAVRFFVVHHKAQFR